MGQRKSSSTKGSEATEGVRMCSHPNCKTQLTRYNKDKKNRCFAHQEGQFSPEAWKDGSGGNVPYSFDGYS